jgi:putative ABC transport system permease protein
MTIMGLSSTHRLTTPVHQDGQRIEVPPDGLVFSDKLAEILDVDVGDQVELTPIRGRRDTGHARVASIVESFLGLEAYADSSYLSRIVGEAHAVNSLQLQVNARHRDELFTAIKELPNAQGLSVRADAKRNIEDTLVQTMTPSLVLMILFAGVIAFGSLVNNSLIEMGDRICDISTFRVLGYRPNQVAAIFFRQNLITFVIGLALSVPLGYGMVVATSAAYDTELYRFPVVFNWESVLATALISVGFVLIAQWIVYRQIHKLDWLEGIKVKE